MKFPSPGRFRSAEAFRAHLRTVAPELGLDMELAGAGGPLGQPYELCGRRLTNRFAIHPMEGWDGTADGAPTELTLRRWRRFGESGAKLIWGGEAFAVAADGRANARQLFFDERGDPRQGLDRLRAALRAGHEAAGEAPDTLCVGLQLTHSGRFARSLTEASAPRLVARHPVLDAWLGIEEEHPLLTDGELEEIGAAFVRSACAARDVGFDFVDVKCCHGYLLHELLGARGRPGRYGGSFDGRTRLFRTIVAGIRAACPELHIGVRLSVGDVYPHREDTRPEVPYEHGFGVAANDPERFDLDEPLRFLRLVHDLDIRLVNVTLGSPYYCPHLQRPAAFPPSDGYEPPRDPLIEVEQHVRTVRAVRRAFPDLALVGSGYSYLQEFLPHVAQHEVGRGHVDFVGLGRMALSYPELPRDVLAGRALARKRICRTFSDCTSAPRNGLVSGCYPLDPHYKALPEAEELQRIKAERRKGAADG